MADLKISQLTDNASPAGEDYVPHVDDPGGTPTTKRFTLTAVAAFLASLTQTLTNKDISSATNTYRAASDTATGAVELATIAETTTGTSTTLAVTPDGLSGSIYGRKTVEIKVIADNAVLATGDGQAYFTVPVDMNGMNLVDADAGVVGTSSSGTPTIQIHNLTQAADMLSTRITIDENENTSYTAAAAAVVDAANDDVATGDLIRIDVDVAGTGTDGLNVILVFATP